MVPLTCVCPCKTNESRSTGIVHQMGTRLWFAITESSSLRTYRCLDRADRRTTSSSWFSSVSISSRFTAVAPRSCHKGNDSRGVKHIGWELCRFLNPSDPHEQKEKQTLQNLKTFSLPLVLATRRVEHVRFLCLFSFLFGSGMNTQSTPLTPGITWC